jgi:hypothetical protein
MRILRAMRVGLRRRAASLFFARMGRPLWGLRGGDRGFDAESWPIVLAILRAHRSKTEKAETAARRAAVALLGAERAALISRETWHTRVRRVRARAARYEAVLATVHAVE